MQFYTHFSDWADWNVSFQCMTKSTTNKKKIEKHFLRKKKKIGQIGGLQSHKTQETSGVKKTMFNQENT